MNLKNIGIPMRDKALLFINGVPPTKLPEADEYSLVACSDGAFHYLKEKKFPLEKLDFISGDFDSHIGFDEKIYKKKFICTPDQNKTDFEKSLEIIENRGYKEVHIYGASGGEMDHFLGNLTVGAKFLDRLKLTFFDDSASYFFSPKSLVLKNVKHHLVSLYPFPFAENVITTGLNWPLDGENLDITSQIGTRNYAISNKVMVQFESGNLIVFVGHQPCREF